MTARRKS